MPVATYRHKEVRADGQPVFQVQPRLKDKEGNFTNRINTHYNGKRAGVTFVNGLGRTVHEFRAISLMETLGYLVVLPEGHPGLDVPAKVSRVSTPLTEPDPDYVIEDDLDFNEDEEESDEDGEEEQDEIIG